MEFKELKKQSNLKVILEGPSGTGKTLSTCKVVLSMLADGHEVLYCDTEAEGPETIVNLVEDGDYDEDVVEGLTYYRANEYKDLKLVLDKASKYELVVIDTLDHKHSYVLKHVTDAKRDSDASWNEYAAIYSEEKELMGRIGDPNTNIIATLDPESGKGDKPKGAQTNIRGYFGAVIETRKVGQGEWGHKILNWVGKSDWIGKAHPKFPGVIAEEMKERL